MKPPVIVLFSADPAVQDAAMTAIFENRRAVRLATDPAHAVDILCHDRSDVELYIIDLDVSTHGVSLLTALNFLAAPAPIILLTSFEPHYCARLVATSGARACLGKPISAERLGGVIKTLLATSGRNPRNCPCPRRVNDAAKFGIERKARVADKHRPPCLTPHCSPRKPSIHATA